MSVDWLRPGPRWWTRLALVVPFVVLLIAGVLFTTHVQRESEQRWCELLDTLHQAYRSQPPKSDLGRQLAASIEHLRQDFRC